MVLKQQICLPNPIHLLVLAILFAVSALFFLFFRLFRRKSQENSYCLLQIKTCILYAPQPQETPGRDCPEQQHICIQGVRVYLVHREGRDREAGSCT